MVAEAEQNRSADQQLRREVDARNELDSLAHQAQRLLDQLGDSVPAHERSRAELLIADARQAVQEQAPIDRARELTTELQSVLSGLQAIRSDGRSGTEDVGETADEDVIDAEFDRS